MEKLGEPKAEEGRQQPGVREPEEAESGEVQHHPGDGQQTPKIKEAGQRAQEGVVGKSPVAEKEGVGPPHEL